MDADGQEIEHFESYFLDISLEDVNNPDIDVLIEAEEAIHNEPINNREGEVPNRGPIAENLHNVDIDEGVDEDVPVRGRVEDVHNVEADEGVEMDFEFMCPDEGIEADSQVIEQCYVKNLHAIKFHPMVIDEPMFCTTVAFTQVQTFRKTFLFCEQCYRGYCPFTLRAEHNHWNGHYQTTYENCPRPVCTCCRKRLFLIQPTDACIMCNSVEKFRRGVLNPAA